MSDRLRLAPPRADIWRPAPRPRSLAQVGAEDLGQRIRHARVHGELVLRPFPPSTEINTAPPVPSQTDVTGYDSRERALQTAIVQAGADPNKPRRRGPMGQRGW